MLDPAAQFQAAEDGIRIARGGRGVFLRNPDPGLARALTALACGDGIPDDLSAIERMSVDLVLARLADAGCLCWQVARDDTILLTLRDMSGDGAPATPLAPEIPGPHRLSRLCRIAAQDGRMCLLAPLTGYEARLHPDLAAALARTCIAVDLDLLGDGALRRALGLLARAGVLVPDTPEPDALETWEAHDLLFHLRARSGFHDHPGGATFRFAGRRAMPPLQRLAAPDAIALDLPDPPAPGSLFDVLDHRRSVRDPDADPLTLDQLSELLFRAARITGLQDTPMGEVGTRPFPGGGGLQELGIYLVVNRVEGLSPGCYRHDGLRHALEPVPVDPDAMGRMLDEAAWSTMLGRRPDVLLVMAGRIQRLSVKYEGIAYSLMLKHVGCLIQTVYLVATELGIGCCAVGDGNSARFARATGIDPLLEPVVGEMILNGTSAGQRGGQE